MTSVVYYRPADMVGDLSLDSVTFAQMEVVRQWSRTEIVSDNAPSGASRTVEVREGSGFGREAPPGGFLAAELPGTVTSWKEYVDVGKSSSLSFKVSAFALPLSFFMEASVAKVWSTLLAGDDLIEGSPYADKLVGLSGNDVFVGNGGGDLYVGGPGVDTVIYETNWGQFKKTVNVHDDDHVSVGADTLVDIERIYLTEGDKVIAFDSSGVCGQAYRVYQAAFGRAPDSKGLGYWIDRMDKGMSLEEVSARFIDSPEFKAIYGTNPTNDEFLTRVYENVLHRAPDEAGFRWWKDQVDHNSEKTWAKVLADFSESPENHVNVVGQTSKGIEYDQWM
jgi:hypothetical protein